MIGRIDQASNGQDAFELVKKSLQDPSQDAYDLIFLDLDMPIMNGLDLAREIRQKWPGIHIILMSSGQFDKEFQDNTKLREYEGFIKKPFVMQRIKQIFLSDPGILH